MSRCSRLFPLSSLRSGGRRPQSTTAAAAARSIDLSTPSPLIDLSQCPSTLLTQLQVQPTELLLYPNVFNQTEQDLLVQAALARLDASLSSEDRAARRAYKRRHGLAKAQGLLPDAAYGFSQSHFDEVITGYRETTCAEWPQNAPAETPALLSRIYNLLPFKTSFPPPSDTGLKTPPELIAHLLHLSSTGHISPHVDNIDASGTLIAGVSLVSERSLWLTYQEDARTARIRVRLPPGSVYVQRDAMRYTFKHAIPLEDTWNDQTIGNEQRISIMFRDRKSNSSE